MLRIRLTRTGKSNQPSYRIVVAEHTAPIKSQFVEILGHYNLARTPRELTVDQDRVKYWVSVGAKPTDSVAVLLKSLGMEGMDTFIVKPRDLKRRKRNATEEATSSVAPKATVTEAPAIAPAPVVDVASEATGEKVAQAAPEVSSEVVAAPEAPVADVTGEETPTAETAPIEATPKEETPKEVSAE